MRQVSEHVVTYTGGLRESAMRQLEEKECHQLQRPNMVRVWLAPLIIKFTTRDGIFSKATELEPILQHRARNYGELIWRNSIAERGGAHRTQRQCDTRCLI